jgi:hypothetical protein
MPTDYVIYIGKQLHKKRDFRHEYHVIILKDRRFCGSFLFWPEKREIRANVNKNWRVNENSPISKAIDHVRKLFVLKKILSLQ